MKTTKIAFLSSNSNRIGTVNEPSNQYLKLKNYLSCVARTFEICDDLVDYIDYNNTSYLTLAEKKNIVEFCYLFNPDEFIGKCWFLNEDMGSNNEFSELSHVRNQLFVTEDIFIGDHNRRVAKVMFFGVSWIDSFYNNPFTFAIQDIQNEGKNLILFQNFKLSIVSFAFRTIGTS